MKSGQTNRYLPVINDNCADPQVPPESLQSDIDNGKPVASNNIGVANEESTVISPASSTEEVSTQDTSAANTAKYIQQSDNRLEIPVGSVQEINTVPNVPGRIDLASGANAPGDFSAAENPYTYGVPGNPFSVSSAEYTSSGTLGALDTSGDQVPSWKNILSSKRALKNARDFRLQAFGVE